MKFCLFLLLLLGLKSINARVIGIDAEGSSIVLSRPAKRIVALSPSTLELLYKIGAGSKVVATTNNADYPEQAKKLPKVGGYGSVSLEAILRNNPDLVVAWRYALSSNLQNRLRDMGVVVFVSNPLYLDDVAKEMLELGKITDRENKARQEVKLFRSSLQSIRDKYKSHQELSVFLQISDNPIFSASSKSFLGQLINLCKGKNIFADSLVAAPQISIESVLRSNPQVIFTFGNKESLKRWKSWRSIKAVKFNTMYILPGNILARPGPRLLDGANLVCRDLDDARVKLGLTRP